MPVQIIGQDNGGTTNNFVGASNLVFPTSYQAVSGDVIRKFVGHIRTDPACDLAVYENSIDDLATATLIATPLIDSFRVYDDPQYIDQIVDVNIPLTAGNYYWVGISGASYIASGSGTSFVSLTNYTSSWPTTAGASSSAGENVNFYAEVANTESKLTTTIATPDSSENSLLKIGVAYQETGAQIRYSEFSDNLNNITVFDDGRFIIEGEGNDSFEVELAKSGQGFDAPITITVADATLQGNP